MRVRSVLDFMLCLGAISSLLHGKVLTVQITIEMLAAVCFRLRFLSLNVF